jgi:peptidyl-tRNA hydrolase
MGVGKKIKKKNVSDFVLKTREKYEKYKSRNQKLLKVVNLEANILFTFKLAVLMISLLFSVALTLKIL